eukprot:6651866-Pyramimonas_sp.AAC.1
MIQPSVGNYRIASEGACCSRLTRGRQLSHWERMQPACAWGRHRARAGTRIRYKGAGAKHIEASQQSP